MAGSSWPRRGTTSSAPFAAIDREDLAEDSRFSTPQARYEHRAALGKMLETVFATRSADEWEEVLTGADVGCVHADRVGHRRFLHEDPHTRTIRFMLPAKHPLYASHAPEGRYWRHGPVAQFSETPCEEGKPYAALGEHTRPILEELGFAAEEIARMKNADIVSWAAD
jgi:crotonobetainyl-CoA:carnitine CoA-transferase CaiB-like acyl-CoA transferase